jgi:glutamate 5-kinase
MNMQVENNRELVVVKYGSSAITGGNSADVRENIRNNIGFFASQIAQLHRQHDVIVVSSGAVAIGRQRHLGLVQSSHTNDQFFAMNGNPVLMTEWIDAFENHGISAGELLVTHNEIEQDKKPEDPGSIMRCAIESCFELNAVPIVNENDALSKIELSRLEYGGDNDGLAGHFAIHMGALALFLMTDVNGLRGTKQRQPRIPARQKSWERAARLAGCPGEKGKGGMKSKVEVATQAAKNGIACYIAPAHKSFLAVQSGRYGTYFEPADLKT